LDNVVGMDAVELLSFKGARELFGTLQAFPRRQFSISELAKAAGLPFTTTRNMVGRFELAQAVDVSLIKPTRHDDAPAVFSKLLEQGKLRAENRRFLRLLQRASVDKSGADYGKSTFCYEDALRYVQEAEEFVAAMKGAIR
jgi:hypothetical protein